MLISIQYADQNYWVIYTIGIIMISEAVILMFVNFKKRCVLLGWTPLKITDQVVLSVLRCMIFPFVYTVYCEYSLSPTTDNRSYLFCAVWFCPHFQFVKTACNHFSLSSIIIISCFFLLQAIFFIFHVVYFFPS